MRLRDLFHRRKKLPHIYIYHYPEDTTRRGPDRTLILPDDIIYIIFETAALLYPPRSFLYTDNSTRGAW